MTAEQFLGALLIAMPFLMFIAFMVREDGWLVAFTILVAIAVIVGCIAGGSYLLKHPHIWTLQ